MYPITEQNMLMAAGGLSTADLIPLACTYATFATMRACEQIRSFICYSRLNVKVICSPSGLEVGWDGPTHQATEDVAIMRAMLNMIVVVPADAVAMPSLPRQVVALDGPTYSAWGATRCRSSTTTTRAKSSNWARRSPCARGTT